LRHQLLIYRALSFSRRSNHSRTLSNLKRSFRFRSLKPTLILGKPSLQSRKTVASEIPSAFANSSFVMSIANRETRFDWESEWWSALILFAPNSYYSVLILLPSRRRYNALARARRILMFCPFGRRVPRVLKNFSFIVANNSFGRMVQLLYIGSSSASFNSIVKTPQERLWKYS